MVLPPTLAPTLGPMAPPITFDQSISLDFQNAPMGSIDPNGFRIGPFTIKDNSSCGSSLLVKADGNGNKYLVNDECALNAIIEGPTGCNFKVKSFDLTSIDGPFTISPSIVGYNGDNSNMYAATLVGGGDYGNFQTVPNPDADTSITRLQIQQGAEAVAFDNIVIDYDGMSGACYVPACAGKDWCVEFNTISAALDGDPNTSDITITYDASAPRNDGNKFYKVSILDGSTCMIPPTNGADDGITPSADYGSDGLIPFGNYQPNAQDDSGESGYLEVELDIDTSKFETGSLAQNAVDDKFDVTFCTKVDLFVVVDGGAYQVDSSDTYVTLHVDKNLDFQFDVSVENLKKEETRSAGKTTVEVNYDIETCVCATGNADPTYTTNGVANCLPTTAYTLYPGDYFKICVQSMSDEASVSSVRNVEFTNSNVNASGLTIPIINENGNGVGPVSHPDCSNGICVLTARTYAQMYEAKVNNQFVSIVDGVAVEGTAILSFNRRRRHRRRRRLREPQKEFIEQMRAETSSSEPIPLKEFDIGVRLATPPDRSDAASPAAATAFVAMTVAGIIGFLMA